MICYSETEHLNTSLNFHKVGLNVDYVLKFSTKQVYIDNWQLIVQCIVTQVTWLQNLV